MGHLGDRIKELRTSCDWSQHDLAQRMEVSKQAISNWERDAAKPDVHQLVRLAEVFRVSADHLLGMEVGPHFVHPQGSIKSRAKHWDWVFQKSYDLFDVLKSNYRFTIEGRILSEEELEYYAEIIRISESNYRRNLEKYETQIQELKAEIERLNGSPSGNEPDGQMSIL